MIKILNVLCIFVVAGALFSCSEKPDSKNKTEPRGTTTQKLTGIFKVPPMKCKPAPIPKNCDCVATPGDCMKDIYTIYDPVTDSHIGMVTWVVNKIEAMMTSATKKIFDAMILGGWDDVVTAAMTLTIAFYGAAILLGITQVNSYTTIMVLIKLSLVWTFATNWNTFNDTFINFFEALVKGLVNITGNIFVTVADPTKPAIELFAKVNGTISFFLSWGFMKIIIALIFSGWMGWFYAGVFLIMGFSYIGVLIGGVKTYLLAMIARFLLYALAPLFITFALFSQTKSLFDAWLEQIINFTLQPIFLFTFLGMFQVLIDSFINTSIVKSATQVVTYRPLIDLGGIISVFNMYQFGTGATGQPYVTGPSADIPFNLWSLISIMLVIYLMKGMIGWSVDVAGKLSGGLVSAGAIPVHGWNAIKQAGINQGVGMVGGMKNVALGGRNMKGKMLRPGGKSTVMQRFKSGKNASMAKRRPGVVAAQKALLGLK